MQITRRGFIVAASAAVVGGATGAFSFGQTTPKSQRYKISAADWMILKRQKLGALQLGKDIGLDGVEIDMGPLGARPTIENHLVEDAFRQSYLDKAKELNLEFSSLAMSCFYGQPFQDHPKAEEFAATWIDLMPKLGTKVGFLPINKKKETSDEEAKKRIVSVFKKIAPSAEKAGVILGLNTSYDSAGNKALLDAIGSPAVRIAYNIGEASDAKRDFYAELKDLGKDRIAEIIPTLSDGKHLKEDERIDVPKLKSILDDIGWSGWLVLQRSRTSGKAAKVQENFSANCAYLKSIFQA
jgi:L-ribulose-5-phosphate 3-epimerase